MLQSFAFRLSIQCPGCRVGVPVNGIVSSVKCSRCGEVAHLGETFWRDTIDEDFMAEALEAPVGEMAGRTLVGWYDPEISIGRAAPFCGDCKTDFDPHDLAGRVAQGACQCPRCGRSLTLRPADGLCLVAHPEAKFMAGECTPDEKENALLARASPVMFTCLGCGAGLRVDGSSRAVTCEYCKVSNYLPDGLWQTLNPVPKPVVFFMVCDFDEEMQALLRWRNDEARIVDARKPGLLLVLYERLASDVNWKVRAALAANPAVPGAILERLVEDSDSDVAEALGRNPSLSAQGAERLALSEETDRRIIATRCVNLSYETLRRLAREDCSQVAQAARERIQRLRAQGVNVGGARVGFLRRLFSG